MTAIDLKLPGGIWMLQIFRPPSAGLFTRWLRAPALLLGRSTGSATLQRTSVAAGIEDHMRQRQHCRHCGVHVALLAPTVSFIVATPAVATRKRDTPGRRTQNTGFEDATLARTRRQILERLVNFTGLDAQKTSSRFPGKRLIPKGRESVFVTLRIHELVRACQIGSIDGADAGTVVVTRNAVIKPVVTGRDVVERAA